MEGSGEVTIGLPQPTLLNDRFLADTSLISGDPCAPPCWQNIVPGETSLADALRIVSALDTVTVLQQTEQAFQFGRPDAPACCQVSADETLTVDAIILQFAPEMTMGDALAKHGEPLFFRGQPYRQSEAILWFYYPELFTMIQVVVPGVDGSLQAGSLLVAAYYLREKDMSGALAAGMFSQWKGYASYQDYTAG